MQLMIDTLVETPDALDLASRFLAQHAALRRLMEGGAGLPPSEDVPTGTQPEQAAVPLAPAAPPAPPEVPAAPTLAEAQVPAPPAPPPPVPSVPVLTLVPPIAPAATLPPSVPTAGPAVDEFDNSGVPYDGRIHQKAKSKKKDGTWKLQKGIDSTIVESIMKELTPRIRNVTVPPALHDPQDSARALMFGQTPLPAGASAPVTLPPVPPPPAQTTQTPAAPPAPPAPQAPGAQEVSPYRALVAKITTAKAAGKITAQEVTGLITGAGVPSIQLLNAMPHKIPEVEAAFDALLLTR